MANKSSVHRFEVRGKRVTVRVPFLFGKPAPEKYVMRKLPQGIDVRDVRRVK